MNNKKIAFITCTNNDLMYDECLRYINNLEIPDGYEIEVLSIKEAHSIASGYNEAMKSSDAKFKVYLHQDTLIINRNFINDIIKIFNLDDNIGMIGVSGAEKLPINGVWWEASEKYGKVYESHTGTMELLKFDDVDSDYKEVEVVDGLIIATQYDMFWREDIFKGWHYYDISQCFEFKLAGYKIAIPKQIEPWCIHDCGIVNIENGYEQYKQILLENYRESIVESNLNNYNINFDSIGINNEIASNCRFINSEYISLGSNIKIGENNLFEASNNFGKQQKISIGNGCIFEEKCCIVADNKIIINERVKIGNNVYISDSNKNKVIGIEEEIKKKNEINIGEGTIIGSNVVIKGNVSIGRNTIIESNSVVYYDIPDRCVAVGSPAKVIEALDYETGTWIKIKNDNELQSILDKRSEITPILTIGIPTFNRAKRLNKCLENIYEQIGNDPLIEVVISDNCSNDNTYNVVKRYENKYNNLVYSRNNTNIGQKNFQKVLEIANGKYVELHGDDDYFEHDVIYNIVNMIYKNPECGMMALLDNKIDNQIKCGYGISDYIENMGQWLTFITALIFNKKEFDNLSEEEKEYTTVYFNQVHFSFQLLKKNPKFAILIGKVYRNDCGEEQMSNSDVALDTGKIFIEDLLDLIYSFKRIGISDKTLKNFKYKLLFNHVIPQVYRCKVCGKKSNYKETINLFKKYYSDEIYYENALQRLNEIIEK